MINSDDVAQWTLELIDNELESGELSNILRICDENFELWTQKLFPVLQAQGKPCYKAVVQLLHRAGCTNANEKMLGSYFSYLRKKRGLTKTIARASSLTQVRSVDVVPTPVVVSHQVAPVETVEVQAPPHQVARSVAKQAVSDDQVAYPHVYAKCSLTPPVDYENFEDDLSSLQEQSRTFWLDWSGTDEWHWLDFLEKIETFNKSYDPKWSVHGNPTEFWKYLEIKDDIALFKLLKKKVVEKRFI
jgi:hypothetical protein